MSSISDRLALIQHRIEESVARAHRKISDVELIAVSKTHPPESLQEVVSAGHNLFGESRLQEARAKQEEVSSRARWHFIGHLQKNKIRAALPYFELFHGIDSLETARQMNRIAEEEGLNASILLEINLAIESTKFGFSTDAIAIAMEELMALPRLDIQGLMAIPPLAPEAEASRPFFVELRECRDALEEEFGVRLPHLSMGMSGDFEIAIEEGATLVRVGTAIFGKRPPRQVMED